MSIDFTKWRVEDIRAELHKLTGMSPDALNAIKGKAVLVDRLIETRQKMGLDGTDGGAAAFDAVEMEQQSMIQNFESEDDESGEEAVQAPLVGSPEWQEYVLSHLTDDELQTKDGKKFPKSSGLRRVVELLIGPIVSSGPVREYMGQNGAYTVVYEIGVRHVQDIRMFAGAGIDIPIRKFSEIADCTKENTPHPYNLHAPATAASKAASRAYKNILLLSCHTAEEMSLAFADNQEERSVTQVTAPEDMNGASSPTQHITASRLCDRNGIDLVKALEFHGLKPDIKELSRAEAADFIKTLNRYQADVADASMQVPDIIKV